MFTGLIEAVGVVEVAPDASADAPSLVVRTGLRDLQLGESVAVNGVCLTVAGIDGDAARMDIGPETARVTTLGELWPGARVNLERAMRADGRFGGHLVQGHVDGVGIVGALSEEDEAHWLTVRYPRALAPYLIHRGAVAVDGISLTVAGLDDERFDIMVVPFTWAHTNLARLAAGDQVNLECDMVGKYVVRAAQVAGTDLAAAADRKQGT